jgi:quercetin dioxygenase-like cupin family protein
MTYPIHHPSPGVTRQTLVVGDKILQAKVEFAPLTSTPAHSHIHEQTVVVLQGEVTMTIGGKPHLLRAGDSCVMPSNVPHEARSGPEGVTMIDTFSPPREDFIELDRKVLAGK